MKKILIAVVIILFPALAISKMINLGKYNNEYKGIYIKSELIGTISQKDDVCEIVYLLIELPSSIYPKYQIKYPCESFIKENNL